MLGLEHSGVVPSFFHSKEKGERLRLLATPKVMAMSTQDSISDVCLEAIAIALVENTTLRELNISRNLITDSGLIMLGQKLQNNTSLETLHIYELQHSPISRFLQYLYSQLIKITLYK